MGAHPLNPDVDDVGRAVLAPFLDIARNMGVGVSGTRGVGKTKLLCLFATIDFTHHKVPCVVIDPNAKVIDGFLHQLSRYRRGDQEELGKRVRYVSWGHPEWVLPTPSYSRYGLGPESLFEVAQRLPDVFTYMDPPLQTAGVQGANPLIDLGTKGGEILQVLGCQATELPRLLRHTGELAGWVRWAAETRPEVADSADSFLTDFTRLRVADRDRKIDSLLMKLRLISDRTMRAQFGGSAPAIPMRQVMDERLIVLHDLSGLHNPRSKQLAMLWLFLGLFDFVKRGGTGREHPLSIIVDEVAGLLAPGPNQSAPLAAELSDFINQWSRNGNCWLTLSFQEPYQLRSPSREAIMSLGTHFYGRMTDPPSARLVAERHYDYDPYDVHISNNVWGHDRTGSYVIDQREEIFTYPEQVEKHRAALRKLPRYAFLQAPVTEEGGEVGELRRVSIERFDRDVHPDEALVAIGKRRLLERHGQRVADVLTEIDGRLHGDVPSTKLSAPLSTPAPSDDGRRRAPVRATRLT